MKNVHTTEIIGHYHITFQARQIFRQVLTKNVPITEIIGHFHITFQIWQIFPAFNEKCPYN